MVCISRGRMVGKMKTREEIIYSMCLTKRHDFGLDRHPGDVLTSGMTETERTALWNEMAQIFDNDILPWMEFKDK